MSKDIKKWRKNTWFRLDYEKMTDNMTEIPGTGGVFSDAVDREADCAHLQRPPGTVQQHAHLRGERGRASQESPRKSPHWDAHLPGYLHVFISIKRCAFGSQYSNFYEIHLVSESFFNPVYVNRYFPTFLNLFWNSYVERCEKVHTRQLI